MTSYKLPSDRIFTYYALKDIKKGEELFINYGSKHPINQIIKVSAKSAKRNHSKIKNK